MLFNYIMAVLIATQFSILSNDKILVCYHDSYNSTVSQIWTVTGKSITKSPRFVFSTDKNQIPIGIKATSQNTFDMKYGKQIIKGIVSGNTITYLDYNPKGE